MKQITIAALAFAMVAAAFGPCGICAPKADAANRAEVRKEIRATPLLERPNRPGHVYGNNVRRVHNLRNG